MGATGFITPETSASSITTGCWIWQGATNGFGYGQMYWAGKVDLVHRIVYEHFQGPIPDGLEVEHACNKPPCCNPLDLRAVTHAENMRRLSGDRWHQFHRPVTACKRGHPFDAANTYVSPDGTRNCRECRRQAKARYLQRALA